jgi:hypothetical protein
LDTSFWLDVFQQGQQSYTQTFYVAAVQILWYKTTVLQVGADREKQP